MTARPTFTWFTAEELIAAAGGDPWAIEDQLHAGDARAIDSLATAFHRAGSHLRDADAQFAKAREQFKAAYSRQNGSEHPINDAAEVKRLSAQLAGHPDELNTIAVNLEETAAALAVAQREATGEIGELDTALHSIDAELSAAGPQLPLVLETLLHEAKAQTKMSLDTLEKIQGTYVLQLRAAHTAMRHSGYTSDAIDAADGAQPGPADAAGTLTNLQHAMDQAVRDEMAKARQIQKEINDAAAIAYTKGPGSAEGQDALARLPGLKQKLVDELNTLGNLPDYSALDPNALSSTSDGKFQLDYNIDGVGVQAYGQLRNGTGEIFDQAKQSYFTFKDGKLVGVRQLDPGRVTPDDELLFNAVTLAVGAPEVAVGVKTAGEGAFHGLKSLLGAEGVAALRSSGDSLLTRSMAAAQIRAEASGYRFTDDLSPRSLTSADHLPTSPVAAGHPTAPPVAADHSHPPSAVDVSSTHHVGAHSDDGSPIGLTDAMRDEIRAMERGSRPDPSEYLSQEYIEHHLEKFDKGGTRFMMNDTYEAYGIGQRDGTTFLFPSSEIDGLMTAAKGDPSALEKMLGLPDGYFRDNVIRVDIPDLRQYDLRMPSGNEAGANDQWLPGGFLPHGMPEAVIDGSAVPPRSLAITDLPIQEGNK